MRSRSVQPYKHHDCQSGDAVQHPVDHRAAALVFEPLIETYFSVRSHRASFQLALRACTLPAQRHLYYVIAAPPTKGDNNHSLLVRDILIALLAFILK